MSIPSTLILAADDDASVRKLLGAMLGAAGYSAITASDGEEALHLVQERQPDVVLLDVRMPVMDGYEACRHLKSNPADFLPVILITGLTDDPYSRVKAIEVDADDFLVKPFRQDELLGRVRSLLRLKKLIAERRRYEVEQARLESELALERFRREEDVHRQRFYREVIQAVTGGKLLLLELEDFEAAAAALANLPGATYLDLDGPHAVGLARRLAETEGLRLGLLPDRLHELVISVSEAATNVVKHAGTGGLTLAGDATRVLVKVEDRGPGIDASAIVGATLARGYSTKRSLGLGFSMMLEQMDRVCLSTDARGTRLLLELGVEARDPMLDPLLFGERW